MSSKRKIRKKDTGLLKHGRYLKHLDNGPLARKLGASIQKGREAIGLTRESLAKHIGATEKYVRDVEEGRCLPSQEAARRFVEVIWAKKTWKDSPSYAAIGTRIDAATQVRISVYDKAFLERWHDFASATGCTVSAVARYALERLFDDSPTLVTIAEGIKAAEKMRAQSLLEAYPEYVQLLRGDPLAAQLVHLAPDVDWRPIAAVEGYKLASDTLLGADKRDNGPASPVRIIGKDGPA